MQNKLPYFIKKKTHEQLESTHLRILCCNWIFGFKNKNQKDSNIVGEKNYPIQLTIIIKTVIVNFVPVLLVLCLENSYFHKPAFWDSTLI